jgi:regulatory associated protein of mTOR
MPGAPTIANGHFNLNGASHDDNDNSDTERRPSSAPGNRKKLSVVTSIDDSDRLPSRRPQIIRSKSEYITRHEEPEHTDEEIYEWGARHGFEDHYQSEDIISQLANVSIAFLLEESVRAGHQLVW